MSTHIANDEQLRSHQLLFAVNMASVHIHIVVHVYWKYIIHITFREMDAAWEGEFYPVPLQIENCMLAVFHSE